MQVSDKETRAVFLNFKEMRCLEKNVKNLDLEEAYSVSLIALEQKVMKVRDKKMRDRTAKIKSHLSQNDIEEMKQLEAEGKISMPDSSAKMGFDLRIAGAAKRLKLVGRAKSAVPRLGDGASRSASRMSTQRTPRSRTPVSSNRAKSAVPDIVEPVDSMADFPVPRSIRTERRNSISLSDDNKPLKVKVPKIAFEDTSGDSDNNKSPQETLTPKTPAKTLSPKTPRFFLQIPEDTSQSGVASQSTTTVKTPTSSKIRPLSVPATQISKFGQTERKQRPSTSNPTALEVRRKSVNDIRRASMLIKSGKTKMPFSTHDAKSKKSSLQQPYRATRDGQMSAATLDYKDNDIGNDLFRQIKQGMLLGEVATSLQIEEQIDEFFDDLDNYKKSNPTHFVPTDLKQMAADMKAEREKNKKKKPQRNQLRRRQLERQLHDIEERKRLAEASWDSMSKCRYLRLEDDRLDMSGVNTLAVDQLRMAKTLRASAAD